MKKIIASLLYIFVANSTFAEFMCDDVTHYSAQYEINSYTCQSGEFLPANTLGCQSCPTGMSCGGGTFDFNPDNFQGLDFDGFPTTTLNNICADNFHDKIFANYEPNQHNCNPGYYMPANTDGCVICPENSYCPGGTYTFNETVPQGITACAAGLFAPAGMRESAQCGRILHIGDEVLYLRATKKTLHALHIDVAQDGIADYFGNMTTADVPMHAGTTRKLKVRFNGQVYSIYDDTVNVGE